MTNEDIIRLALKHFGAVLKPSDLEVKLAALAVAAEREACAEVCELGQKKERRFDTGRLWCAMMIRKRGEK